jgi:hypothetical protein
MINGITGLPPNPEQRIPPLPDPIPLPDEFSEQSRLCSHCRRSTLDGFHHFSFEVFVAELI